MAKLDRNGVAIHYEVHGKGPTILLSHGYSSTSRMWDDQVAALKDRYQVIVWDFRGHGESDYPKDGAQYSEALTVGDMAALLDLVGAKTAIVAGLSLGGYMSLAFHASHPERVRALMLFDTGPGFKKDEARDEVERVGAQARRRLRRRAVWRRSTAPTRCGSPAIATRPASPARRAACWRKQNDRVIQSLDSIKVPTLVLVGANDTNFLAATDYMAAKIKGSTKVVIPDAGHAANLHQPARFNQAVEAFLAKLPAA